MAISLIDGSWVARHASLTMLYADHGKAMCMVMACLIWSRLAKQPCSLLISCLRTTDTYACYAGLAGCLCFAFSKLVRGLVDTFRVARLMADSWDILMDLLH